MQGALNAGLEHDNTERGWTDGFNRRCVDCDARGPRSRQGPDGNALTFTEVSATR